MLSTSFPSAITRNEKWVIYSDRHYPYHSEQLHKRLIELIKDEKPTALANLGDEFDNHEIAKFNINRIAYEFTQNHGKTMPELYKDGVAFHDEVLDAAPKGARKVWIWGNHEVRIEKALDPLKHVLDGYNPLVLAINNSRHRIELFSEFPNNEFVLCEDPFIILSHKGKGTGINHASATWRHDFSQSASRIYGDTHTPMYYSGRCATNLQMRDNRFSLGIGTLCDKTNLIGFGYADSSARARWAPSVAIVQLGKGGRITVEEILL